MSRSQKVDILQRGQGVKVVEGEGMTSEERALIGKPGVIDSWVGRSSPVEAMNPGTNEIDKAPVEERFYDVRIDDVRHLLSDRFLEKV